MKRVLQLSDIAEYVDDTVRSDSIGLEQYVTTDSLLQNKVGRSLAANLPPKVASLVAFKKGDTLVANIRPYLKKIWLADCCGGASQDVLVFRAKVGVPQEYLFATLLQDAFFDYVMKAPKGSKMPRGDESHIMRFPLSQIDISDQRKMGKFLSSIDRMIELSRKRIENLEKLAKEIYDYWFVQFDFPDKRGKPFKTSGGKMVYNAELKREIPAGWLVKRFGDLVSINEGQVNPQKMGDRQLEHYSIPAYDDSRYPVMERASSILSNKFKVTAEAFLVSKLNPQFKRLWDPVCVTADAVCSTEFIVCRSKDEINKPFNYGVADSEAFQIYMRQRSSSSTGSRKRLDPKDILKFKLAMPLDNVLLNKFNKLAGDCLAMIKESRKGIHDLTQLREFLLPLLMNGQAKLR